MVSNLGPRKGKPMTKNDKLALSSAALALVILALAWWGFGW